MQPFVTWNEFTADTLLLSQQILDRFPGVCGVAGCPRSGLQASEIAIRLDVSLYEASAEFGLRRCSSGMRMYKSQLHGVRRVHNGPIVIVEDSTCSGHSVRALKNHPQLAALPIFAVYAGNQGRSLIDGFAVNLDMPHWFEWNFFGNGQLLRENRVGMDWDGVLNDDCPLELDDDGPDYLEWIRSVKPIRTPRAYRVPFIITARRDVYRAECETWLERYGINYGELVMFPGSFQQRGKTDIGEWKAQQCRDRNVRLFVESCPIQSRTIAGCLKSTVLCTNA